MDAVVRARDRFQATAAIDAAADAADQASEPDGRPAPPMDW